jgi:hypothetical protein
LSNWVTTSFRKTLTSDGAFFLADAVAGAVADATVGMSIGTEMSSGGIVLDTGGVIIANFTSLLISFVFLNTTVAAAVDLAASVNSVTGALVGVEKSDDTIFYTDGVFGAVFASLSVLFSALGSTVVAAAAAGVGALAGSATAAVASKLVRT